MLNDEVREETRRFLEQLAGPVRLVMFTQEFECDYCSETRQLVEEIEGLSERIQLEVYDFQSDAEKAMDLGIDKIPAIAVIGAQDYGVRLYGIPSGYEFTSLLHAIRIVAAGKPELAADTLEALAALSEPVHLQVFVTPTCPYCPQAVTLAHQMAIASPLVRADMIEATEFPQEAIKYQVMGVPRTVINETVHVEGAAPESTVLRELQKALADTAQQA